MAIATKKKATVGACPLAPTVIQLVPVIAETVFSWKLDSFLLVIINLCSNMVFTNLL